MIDHELDGKLPAGLTRWLPDASFVSVRVPDARHFSEDALRTSTLDAYRQIRTMAAGRYVVRMWNFIPGLLEPTTAGHDRYMAFNAGRFAALCEWFGAASLESSVPAASGVGTRGDDLVIHAMLAPSPGRSVQNPRQVAPVKYSARYGPVPPCFSRATRVGDVLLVSGTASITGEESAFAGDLDRQLDVTFENLSALLTAGFGETTQTISLAAFRALRVYFPMAADYTRLAARIAQKFTNASPVEFVNVDLCRRELLVEIEGVAIRA